MCIYSFFIALIMLIGLLSHLNITGANGAGKSTTMGMLCGTLEATFGDAFVNNHSITTDCSTARRNLGICMQQVRP